MQARASLCSVSGKEMAVNMCYRSLYIGTGGYYSVAAGNASSYSVQYNYVFSLQVLIWMCALQTTGIVTTFQGNMPVYFMMRYAIFKHLTCFKHKGGHLRVHTFVLSSPRMQSSMNC